MGITTDAPVIRFPSSLGCHIGFDSSEMRETIESSKAVSRSQAEPAALPDSSHSLDGVESDLISMAPARKRKFDS